ncbi:16S rRNA (guanine(966)-N(2))-methyltransferase RsmD [Chloroflexota bacterium]
MRYHPFTVRIIAGEAKGHRLKFPKGTKTRPATELVRGAIFSILENITVKWEQVLDLFSGSGSLGIEALSRGANWVDFVEREPKCCAIIRDNLAEAKLVERARIYCCGVEKALSFLDKEYGIIVIDPPYSDSSIGNLLERLSHSKLVGGETVLVLTHSPHLSLVSSYGSLNLIKERRHGDSCIAIYQKGGKS